MCSNSDYFLSIMTGKLLGDGCFTKQKGRKPRFQFIHRAADFEWSQHCYEQLKEFLPLNPPKFKKTPDPRMQKGFTKCYFVQSKTDEAITQLEKIWYTNRIKKLPLDFITIHLDEAAIAWWYQDDGHLSQKDGVPKKIILSTDNFTTEENNALINILKTRYHLIFTLDKQNRLILYDQFQILYFLRLIEGYIHPSMLRKMPTNTHLKSLAKTTTIYLPSSLQLKKPTYEINTQLAKLKELYNYVNNREGHIQFFKQYCQWASKKTVTSPYRIIINHDHKVYLSKIKQNTGLSNSKIIEWCFQNEF